MEKSIYYLYLQQSIGNQIEAIKQMTSGSRGNGGMSAERVWVCVMMIISIRSRMQSLICLLGLCQVTALSGAEMFFPRREREKTVWSR